jgi:hypothetical protein
MTYAILDSNNRCTALVASEPSSGWAFDAPRWTSYEFLNRFTPVERKLIWARSKTDEDIADFLMLSQAAQEVVSDDPATIAGMGLLVSKNILTAARKDAILGGT